MRIPSVMKGRQQKPTISCSLSKYLTAHFYIMDENSYEVMTSNKCSNINSDLVTQTSTCTLMLKDPSIYKLVMIS